MARFLKVGLKAKNLPLRLKTPENDTTHPLITHWPNRCVLCGLCIHACRTANGRPLMTFAGRGFDTVVRFFVSDDLAPPDSQCEDCNACIRVCPVAALTPAQ